MKQLAALLSIAAAAATSAWAGPLGLDMGMSGEQVEQALGVKLEPGSSAFSFAAATTNDPDFQFYILMITPSHGLCKMTAVSKPITTNVNGRELREAFEDFSEQLKEHYGKPSNEFDFVREGSFWGNDPKYWMNTLKEAERELATYWQKPGLASNLVSVEIAAKAIEATLGSVGISYVFRNIEACLAEAKQGRSNRL